MQTRHVSQLFSPHNSCECQCVDKTERINLFRNIHLEYILIKNNVKKWVHSHMQVIFNSNVFFFCIQDTLNKCLISSIVLISVITELFQYSVIVYTYTYAYDWGVDAITFRETQHFDILSSSNSNMQLLDEGPRMLSCS